MKIKLPKLKNSNPMDNKGQALLLIVIVLFIVFFLVVSLSENISVDTVTIQNNNDFTKALAAAQSGVAAAEKYALTSLPTSNVTNASLNIPCNYQTTGGSYQCSFVIIPSTSVNTFIGKDQTAQAYVAGSTSANISFSDAHTALLINVTKTDNTNFMCIVYPDSLYSTFSSFKTAPGCPNPDIGNASGGYFQTTINLPANAQFLRATAVSYYTDGTPIVITPSSTSSIQQYEIIGTGFFSGSRRIIDTHISLYGDAPPIFDYALFNGGQGSPISF